MQRREDVVVWVANMVTGCDILGKTQVKVQSRFC